MKQRQENQRLLALVGFLILGVDKNLEFLEHHIDPEVIDEAFLEVMDNE
jgi:hypothetical protein